ncbi:GNAT family N-acetyltransferase [Lentibacillus juripiscarius]|uniref:GNAT family N-acetyltransferase n=1 Tax=Lentibacillus juripiscarius TaxID=257446 RepID=A0ABW5V6U8_9BACI
MVIRKATSSELQMIQDHSEIVKKEATVGNVEANREKVIQMVSQILSAGGYYLVHAENNEVKGWIGIGKTFNFLLDEMHGIIPELYVIPRYRKQGIAGELCKEACRQLKIEGYKKVQLNVFKGNHAKKLYEKLDFYEVSSLMEKEL